MTILVDCAGLDREVHLTVVVDREHPHDGAAMPVACEDHGAWPDDAWIARIGEGRPPQSVIVLSVQISDEDDFVGRT